MLVADRYEIEGAALHDRESRASDRFTERDVVLRPAAQGEVAPAHPVVVRVLDRFQIEGVEYAAEEATHPVNALEGGRSGREAMARLFDALAWLESRDQPIGSPSRSHIRIDPSGRLKLRVPPGPPHNSPHLALLRVLSDCSTDPLLARLARRSSANASAVAAALRAGAVPSATVDDAASAEPPRSAPIETPPGGRASPRPVKPVRGVPPAPVDPAPADQRMAVVASPCALNNDGCGAADETPRARPAWASSLAGPVILGLIGLVCALVLLMVWPGRGEVGAPEPGASNTPVAMSLPAAEPSRAAPSPGHRLDPRPLRTPREGRWWVQLLATKSIDNAHAQKIALPTRHPSALGGRNGRIQPTEGDGTRLYRVQFGPFSSKEAARAACVSVKATGEACMVKAD